MKRTKKSNKTLWIPISLWNLNELFTTESISPISFYSERGFGNPVNRNHEKIEDLHNLILFDQIIKSDILISISTKLLDSKQLNSINPSKINKVQSFEYPKTIFLKKGLFKIIFNGDIKLHEFLNNTFMLLEVKTVNKYKSCLIIDENLNKETKKAFYQTQLITNKNESQPSHDKAYNQIKGLIYGLFLGTNGALGGDEQALVTGLTKLKNTIGSIHTDIAMTDQYSDLWYINICNQIIKCQSIYSSNFGQNSEVLELLILRLKEVDKLNKMRCQEYELQNNIKSKKNHTIQQNKFNNLNERLLKLESNNEVKSLRGELLRIKEEEQQNGQIKGKKREYYKKGTYEYTRKKELKQLILDFEQNYEFIELKRMIKMQKEILKNLEFGFTQYDSSISDQFSRISEYLHEIIKKSSKFFLNEKNNSTDLPDISFNIDINKLSHYYNSNNINNKYENFVISTPKQIINKLTEAEHHLLTISINSVLSCPQGQLGDFSEENILKIIKIIGQNLPNGLEKEVLRDYYKYRIGQNSNFNFPKNAVLGNILVFLMKLNGHEQINKMLISKDFEYKYIAFMLYGAYTGFANMPKTFTNIIFDSNNDVLYNYLDDYLFEKVLNM